VGQLRELFWQQVKGDKDLLRAIVSDGSNVGTNVNAIFNRDI
jgi:hypothetical protein